MQRNEQAILISTFTLFSWLMMQVAHEVGLITAALATGTEIIQVYLHPLIVSSTDVWEPRNPLLIVWAGPVAGVLLPLAAYLVARMVNSPGLYLFRFFAGFCLVTNGVYIAFGPSEGGADAAVMIEHGTPRWVMLLFGLAASSLGLYLWHRQGNYFGLGSANGKVDRTATLVSATLLLIIVTVEVAIGNC